MKIHLVTVIHGPLFRCSVCRERFESVYKVQPERGVKTVRYCLNCYDRLEVARAGGVVYTLEGGSE